MNWWEQQVIDYCERLDGRFWSEPLNAVSNAAFLVAAASAYALLRRRGGEDVLAAALTGVTAAVGLGSFAFHTLATRGAELLDVVPIAAFIYGYFLLTLRRFFGLSPILASALTIAFAVANTLFASLAHGVSDSLAYLPAFMATALSAAGLWFGPSSLPGGIERRRETAKRLTAAAATFLVSLFFRTIDRAVCPAFPLGTHFLWHLLNACVLWLLLRAAILAKADAGLVD